MNKLICTYWKKLFFPLSSYETPSFCGNLLKEHCFTLKKSGNIKPIYLHRNKWTELNFIPSLCKKWIFNDRLEILDPDVLHWYPLHLSLLGINGIQNSHCVENPHKTRRRRIVYQTCVYTSLVSGRTGFSSAQDPSLI